MKRFLSIALIAVFIIVLGAQYIYSRSKVPEGYLDSLSEDSDLQIISDINNLSDYIAGWPVYIGMQQTDEIAASFNCMGQYGLGYYYHPLPFNWPLASFKSPNESNLEYLFAGAIWIGGIVDGDTLVSGGADGWHYAMEMWPEGNPPGPAITRFDYISDSALRAEFYDTLTDPAYVSNDPFLGRPHIPLNLKIANRSHVWQSDPFNVIYDMVITNIGDQPIEQGYIGFYIDADVHISGTTSGYDDDLTGSLRDAGIGYIIDNDGDPVAGSFNYLSPLRIFAFKFLDKTFNATDTSYNWWISNGDPELDFGPRMAGTVDDPFRDFGGFLGTPEGDHNKYYIMRHQEWDYDQVSSFVDNTPLWLPRHYQAINFADGHDTRFLMAIGPFDLLPDSSTRLLYTTFTCDSVHVDPDNFANNFDPENPEIYLSNLKFDNVINNAGSAASLSALLIDAHNPVTGLTARHEGEDSVVVDWDPWVFSEVEGYDIYISEADYSSWPYPGVSPPWFEPTTLEYHGSVGREYRYTFTALAPHKGYYANVANRTAGYVGDGGHAIFVRTFDYNHAPVVEREFIFNSEGGPAHFYWNAPEGIDVHHYNIYKFANADSAANKYYAFYDEGYSKDEIIPKDSFDVNDRRYYYYAMNVYDQVVAESTEYLDYSAQDENVYVITAEDSLGFETVFSEDIQFYVIGERNKDILVLFPKIRNITDMTWDDTVMAFYDSILQDYDYEFYNFADTVKPANCDMNPLELCADWHDFMAYKMIIVDDGLYNDGSLAQYEDIQKGLTKYLLSGGKVCNFETVRGYLGIPGIYYFGPEYFGVDNLFFGRFFGVDSVFCVSVDYYFENADPPYVDSLFGFIGAEPPARDLPFIGYDTTRYPFYYLLGSFWPENTAPMVSTFTPNENGITEYLFRSRYPESSINEGEPVGIVTHTEGTTTYLFGFHLWYMEYEPARQLIDFAMGTGSRSGLSPYPVYALYLVWSAVTEVDITLSLAPGAYTIYDIDTTSVLINNSLVPYSFEYLPPTDSTDDMLKMSLPLADFLSGYLPQGNTVYELYTLSWQFNDQTPGEILGWFKFVGHTTGDVNDDGLINLLDITYLIAYLYKNGPQPVPMIEAGDVNCTGGTDILDITNLINYLYKGGEAPNCYD